MTEFNLDTYDHESAIASLKAKYAGFNVTSPEEILAFALPIYCNKAIVSEHGIDIITEETAFSAHRLQEFCAFVFIRDEERYVFDGLSCTCFHDGENGSQMEFRYLVK